MNFIGFGIIIFVFIFLAIASIFYLANYILTATALYLLAKDRRIENPWLGFLPFCDCLLIGKLSEDVYLGRKKVSNPGLWLMIAKITIEILAFVQLFVSLNPYFSFSASNEFTALSFQFGYMLFSVFVYVLSILTVGYMGLLVYSLFKKYNEKNAVLFAVLSCIFSISFPFFIFYIRNKYNKKACA